MNSVTLKDLDDLVKKIQDKASDLEIWAALKKTVEDHEREKEEQICQTIFK